MKTLSNEAKALLESLLERELDAQVADGKGHESMPSAWTELYILAVL